MLNGSSRKNGNISKFISEFRKNLDDIEIINTYYLKNVDFCLSCDYCRNHVDCVINDNVSSILKKIIEANVLIIATPIYFETFPASLKLLIDRMQPLYYNVESKLYKPTKKKCYTILTAGMDRKGQFDHITKIINVIYRQLNGTNNYELLVSNTDKIEVDINNYQEEIKKIIEEIKEV